MLFDYILNDRNLAIPMKALIGRLQLSIVKLAVIDKSLFEQSSHAARQLLNELSSTGIGWSNAEELKRDALYNKIESIVLRVMNAFGNDPAIFTELLRELRNFVHKHERKNNQAEQRVKETETGRARRFSAKDKVQKLINHKASGMRLPPDVGRFISKTWSRVLVYACVGRGEDSADWQRHVQTLDDLLWALQPLDDLVDLENREAMREDLLENLTDGMVHLQMPERDQETQTELLARHLDDIAKNDRSFLEDDELPRVDDTFEEMAEIVLAAQPQREPDVTDQIEAKFLEQIEQLTEGVWVELLQENNEKLRCKLSTIVEPGSRHIFVNRRGMKVAEKTPRGLAAELKRGSLTILAEPQVFDRALQAVIGNLRQMHETAATAPD